MFVEVRVCLEAWEEFVKIRKRSKKSRSVNTFVLVSDTILNEWQFRTNCR
jgi:hypothetical protein